MKKVFIVLGSIFLFEIFTSSVFTQYIGTGRKQTNINSGNNILIIGTIERPPFSIGNDPEHLQGFSIELWKEIAKKLDLSYQFQIFTGFSDMINSVANNSLDGAIANISITSEREEKMDFSFPIFHGGLHILIRKERNDTRNAFEKIHDIVMSSLLLRILSVVVFTIIVLLITMMIYPQYKNKKSRHIFFYIVGILIFAFIMMHAKHIQYQQTSSKYISSYKDLVGKKVGVGKNTTMSRFLDKKQIPYIAYDDARQSLVALESGQIDAIVVDAPIAEYYVNHEGKDRVQLAGKLFAPDQIAIALQKNSPFLEDINNILLEMKENGEYEQLRKKWFGR